MPREPESFVDDADFGERHVRGREVKAPRHEAFDFVVVGSGAAGAVAAHRLVTAGFRVALVEEGPWVKTRMFTEDVYGAFTTLLRDSGLSAIRGRSFIPMLQGRAVGGSTVVNSAIAWRVPGDVLASWRSAHGLVEMTEAALEPHYDALERDLVARPPDPEVLGENSRLFLRATDAAGIRAAPMSRYDAGCVGAARCLTGCPHGKKNGMNVTYVPWALANGAVLFDECRVREIEIAGGRAVSVRAIAVGGGELVLDARRGILLAASTVQTPGILRRSGVRSAALGEHFQAHPGIALAGVFDAPVKMSFGATQGAESLAFRGDGFKIETIAMPPDLAAARIPGVGSDLVKRLYDLGHVAIWAAQIRAEAHGTVRQGLFGGDQVRYSLGSRDVAKARHAVLTIARLMLRAGAREVWPGIHGVPAILRNEDDLRCLEGAPLDPRAYSFIATHLFGAARMGTEPASSVVGPDFGVHGMANLYVVDSSVFPTNLGVNPQHTIMAIARLAATTIAERCLTTRAA